MLFVCLSRAMLQRAIDLILVLSTFAAGIQSQNINAVRIYSYGVSVTLTCTERDNVTFNHWLLPDVQTIVDQAYTGDQVTLLSNWSLHIAHVDSEHLGDYVCRVNDIVQNKPLYFKTELYLYVPPVWEIYRQNFIVGGSAAAVLLGLFLFVCTLDSCSYTARQRRKQKRQDVELPKYSVSSSANGGSSSADIRNNSRSTGKYLAPDGTLLTENEAISTF